MPANTLGRYRTRSWHLPSVENDGSIASPMMRSPSTDQASNRIFQTRKRFRWTEVASVPTDRSNAQCTRLLIVPLAPFWRAGDARSRLSSRRKRTENEHEESWNIDGGSGPDAGEFFSGGGRERAGEHHGGVWRRSQYGAARQYAESPRHPAGVYGSHHQGQETGRDTCLRSGDRELR